MSTSFIFAGLLFAVFFMYLNSRTARRAASYKLYAVRDRLILLVAQGKLSEDSRIFQYYYSRVNDLIALAPNIGFDDVLNGYIILKENKNFEKSMKEAEARANEMHRLLKTESTEISDAVSAYYSAAHNMMLAHSSIIKLLYLFLVRLHGHNLIYKIIPGKMKNFLRVIKFTESEASQFKIQTARA